MSFDVRRVGRVIVVAVHGELTLGNGDALKEEVMERLAAGARRFLFDFEAASYIDSAGLGVLVSLESEIGRREGTLRLAGLDRDMRTLFQLTRLDELFPISESRTAALREL